MKDRSLTNFFEKFIAENKIFTDKGALQSNFTPETVLHRASQIEYIANVLGPALRQEKPSNLFIYGKTGTGKTVTVKHILKGLGEIAHEKQIPLGSIYINCKLKRTADTEYRLIAQLIRELGQDVPATGLPTDEVYNLFYSIVDREKKTYLLVLDEIDQVVKKAGDELIYNLTRINAELKSSKITVVGISNSLTFTEELDPRVKSSLSEEELVFPPYNALQIQDILKARASIAFREGVLASGVIEKCAAYAAREHGDARRALELLRVAGELVDRENRELVQIADLDKAEEKIEKDRVLETVVTQPRQSQVALYSILLLFDKSENKIFTGDIYEVYKGLCPKTDLRPLTQRRISDIVAELDMLGIINARVVSKGRYGRTKELTKCLSGAMYEKLKKILEKELDLRKDG
jgi:cell division control protein 6